MATTKPAPKPEEQPETEVPINVPPPEPAKPFYPLGEGSEPICPE